MAWVDGIPFLNPAAGTILVDTGSMGPGVYRVAFLLDAPEVGCRAAIERRNAANDTTLQSHPLTVGLSMLWSPGLVVELAAQERLRLALIDAVTGTVEAALNVERARGR